MTWVIGILLALSVLASWVGAIGFLRLRTAYDRLHCVTLASAGTGLPLAGVGFVSDGLSARAIKILLLAIIVLISGSAVGHATARALLIREQQ